MSDLQAFFLKGFLVLASAPFWWPFLKAVWQELNESMEDEGGLFGRPPTQKELQVLERERQGREDPLVHEPWPDAEERLRGRRRLGARPAGAAAPRGDARAAGPRRAGFR
ncbi:MAG: hypothetical protein H6828_09850 [Planctomycetes bacterium]|nr:hypothetical protein [Planctomycetota bacterium]